MNPHLDRLFDLVRRTGERLVVIDGEQEPLVVLPLVEYERLVEAKGNARSSVRDSRSDAENGSPIAYRVSSAGTGNSNQSNRVIDQKQEVSGGLANATQQPPWVKRAAAEGQPQTDQSQPLPAQPQFSPGEKTGAGPAPHRGEAALDDLEDEYFPEPLE